MPKVTMIEAITLTAKVKVGWNGKGQILATHLEAS
jgi:hypothetical protein